MSRGGERMDEELSGILDISNRLMVKGIHGRRV